LLDELTPDSAVGGNSVADAGGAEGVIIIIMLPIKP
jgi:hypothetical protein